MPKQAVKLTPKLEEIKEKILTQITDLLDNHLPGSVNVVEESESKTGNLTFTACIDLSESVGHISTTSRYSQVVKDTRAGDLDDVSQPRLPGAQFERNAEKNGEQEADAEKEPFNPVLHEGNGDATPKKRGRKPVDNAAA